MALMRWNPFRDAETLERELGRIFEGPFFRLPAWRREAAEEMGELDVFETDSTVVVKAFLPGVKPDDIKVSASDHTIEISGESRQDQEVKQDQFHRREHHYGSFRRTIALPLVAVAEKAEATYEHGTLTITMPKSDQSQTHTIPVTVASTGNGTKG
jgi:HSP20 family protein